MDDWCEHAPKVASDRSPSPVGKSVAARRPCVEHLEQWRPQSSFSCGKIIVASADRSLYTRSSAVHSSGRQVGNVSFRNGVTPEETCCPCAVWTCAGRDLVTVEALLLLTLYPCPMGTSCDPPRLVRTVACIFLKVPNRPVCRARWSRMLSSRKPARNVACRTLSERYWLTINSNCSIRSMTCPRSPKS